ncbi:1-phosphofructokinase family hexose kinase [Rhodobacterales bacterium HKCCE3408]|nr:1-phosphofructokinase family hexose kinase [Rhodobacterales bacterium HKCCE3408]
MTEILTITVNPALDLSTTARAVIPDQKLRCTAPQVHPGGGGVNVSRAITNLGGSSHTLIAYGGATGEELVRLLREEGLEPESLGIDYPTRQSTTVFDSATGLQYRFMMPGPDWTEADCIKAHDAIIAAVKPGALVIPSGSLPPGMPMDFFLDLAPEIAALGGRMILDTSGAALEHAAATKAGLYVLRMDLAEARELSGRNLVGVDEIAALASDLRQKTGAEIVMVAAGAQGTVIACEGWRGLTRPPVVVPRSKVGAGDSFIGAFALSLTRGEDPVTACAWGTAAAASAVTTEGTELCSRTETERFFSQVTRTEL